MKTQLITDASALTKAIGVAAKASHALAGSIQIALASCSFFALKDGNVQPINLLFTSMGKGVRRAAMQAWLLDHAPVLLQTDKDKAKEQPFVFSRDKVEELTGHAKPTAEQAEETAEASLTVSWVEFKPEQLTPESFDVQAMVTQVIKKAKGLQSKGSKAVHGDLIAKLEAMTATVSVASL